MFFLLLIITNEIMIININNFISYFSYLGQFLESCIFYYMSHILLSIIYIFLKLILFIIFFFIKYYLHVYNNKYEFYHFL